MLLFLIVFVSFWLCRFLQRAHGPLWFFGSWIPLATLGGALGGNFFYLFPLYARPARHSTRCRLPEVTVFLRLDAVAHVRWRRDDSISHHLTPTEDAGGTFRKLSLPPILLPLGSDRRGIICTLLLFTVIRTDRNLSSFFRVISWSPWGLTFPYIYLFPMVFWL